MPEQDATGLIVKAELENLLRVHDCSGDTAFGNADFLKEPVRAVKKQDPEFFIRQVTHQGFEDLESLMALGDLFFEDYFGFVSAAGQGKYGRDLNGPHTSNTLDLLQVGNT